jgi:hypothetical protein
MLGTCVPNLRGRWWVEHTQIHPALKKSTKSSITLANLEEFLVISIFHETKIPMVCMKIQVYSKPRKNKIWKKVKSPIPMRIGTFNTTKCRSKTFQKKKYFNNQPLSRRRSTANGRSLVAGRLRGDDLGSEIASHRITSDHRSGLGRGRATRLRPLVADCPMTSGR